MSYLIMNPAPSQSASPVRSQAAAAQLKKGINTLKGSFFDLDTGHVNYGAMKGSEAYQSYLEAASALRALDPRSLSSQQERLTFWINLYNALTVHGIIELGIENSVREKRGFFKQVAYQVGAYTLSLDDMEHGVLRQNQKQHLFSRRPFKFGDPRLLLCLETPEPRIHFTLVCGSKSCPPIGTYQLEQIEQQLDLAASSFINSENVQVDPQNNRLGLSKIFQWYGKDFGSRSDLLRFLAKHRRNPKEQQWLAEKAVHARIDWLAYDWDLNH